MRLKCTPMSIAAFVATLALLGACTVGPQYVRPSVATPSAYKEAGEWKIAQPRDEVKRGKWWEIFGDARLNALVEQIDISNQNVLAAEARFRQARALVQQARAGLFPSVTGSAAVTRSASSSSSGATTRGGGPSNNYNLALDANWEVDVWGRVRKTVESNAAGAQASVADLEVARLLAQAELALDYFQLRVLDAQQQLLDDSVAAFQKSLDVTRNRYTAGVAGKVDVVQGETQLKSTQAQAIDIGVQRAQLEHAIAILIGKPPAEFSLARIALERRDPIGAAGFAVGIARAPARYRRRRTPGCRRQRAGRGREGSVFPSAHAVGFRGIPELELGAVADVAEPFLGHRSCACTIDFRRRLAARADRPGDRRL